MERINVKRKTKGLIRAVVSAIFAFVLIFSLTTLASAEEAGSFDAEFGGICYETLPEAIEAANAAGGGTVSLLRDVNLAQSLTISSDITLTGAYSVKRSASYTNSLFVVDENSVLALDGGIIIDGNNHWVLDYDTMYNTMMSSPANVSTYTFVTAEAGAPVATDYMFKISGSVVLGDATIQNNYGKVLTSVFSISSTATVTLNSGARVTHNAAINLENVNKINASVAYIANGGHLIVNDGAEISRNHMVGNNSSLAYMEGSFTVNGGEICNNSSVNCGGLVAMIDNTGLLTVNGGHIHDNINVVKNGANAAGIFFVYGTARFYMNGGLVEKNYSSGTTLIYAYSASTVELNGGTVHQEPRATSSGYTSFIAGNAVIGDGMVIDGGLIQFKKSLTTNATIDSNVWFVASATSINGGVFNGSVRVANNLTITGGVYNGEITVDSGYTLGISGGSFAVDPSEWLADYCEVFYDEASGLYTVEKYYEASFDGVNYDSIEEAIAAAITAGGGRVTLLHDVDLDASITVSADVEIFGEYTIFRADSYTGNLFTVPAGATLTLDGGVVIDGANEWTLDYEALYNCMMANGEGITTTTFCTPQTGAPKASAHIFKVSGNVVVNNATIKNHFLNAGINVFNVVSGASVTLNDGAIFTHNATVDSKVMANVAAGGVFIINEGAEISYNHSDNGNGSLSYVTGSMTINGGEIHHNTQSRGAGVLAYIAGSLVINGGHLYENMDVQESGSTSSLIYSNTAGITFIMNGGLIEKNYSNGATTIYIKQVNSTVELNSGIIRQEHRAIPGSYTSIFNCAVYIGEDMIIEGGILRIQRDSTTKGTFSGVVQFGANVTDVSDGSFNGDVELKNSPTMTVSGGTWLGSITVDAGGNLSIIGGSFRENPSEWVHDDFGAIYDPESEMYSVIETAKASVNGVEYNSLAEAIAAANSGDTVMIIASHRIRSGIVIDKDIIIDSHYQSITASDEVAVAFTVLANVTVKGNGNFDTDNGHTDVFLIGNESVEGSLVISNGKFVGENSVASLVNGSLLIDGGDFAVNPDGETPDYSTLINISEASPDGAKREVGVRGGSFHHFNPAEANIGDGGEITVDPGYDSVEKDENVFSVITHSFTNYVSNMDATCDHDGTMTAKCDNCDAVHTVAEVGTAGHVFTTYTSDGNANCTHKGTKTAKCDRCDATDTVEGDDFGDHEYKNCKCVHCSKLQVVRVAIIAAVAACTIFLFVFMRFDVLFRPF